jgi:von Willebrand factor type A domain
MIEFLTPLGWLVALGALLPLTAGAVRARRDAVVRRRIGLAPPARFAQGATATAAALAIALLAAATARPAVRTQGTQGLRTDVQLFFVLDVSRSMLARLPHGATRFTRALAAAERLRGELRNVPAGVASYSDRPLPHLFPTADRHVFSAVLHRSIGIQRPASESGRTVHGVATNFDPLTQLATAGYFNRATRHKLVILLTDGESNAYSPAAVARVLRSRHVRLLVVRFWNAHERVYRQGGAVEPYRPEPSSLNTLEILAKGAGNRVYAETELRSVLRAARALIGHGPTRQIGAAKHLELAPYMAVAAVLPIVFVLRRRDP